MDVQCLYSPQKAAILASAAIKLSRMWRPSLLVEAEEWNAPTTYSFKIGLLQILTVLPHYFL